MEGGDGRRAGAYEDIGREVKGRKGRGMTEWSVKGNDKEAEGKKEARERQVDI